MSTITPFEKTVYNTWLRTVRARSNQPFRARQKWDNINPQTFVHLTKLSSFFTAHKHIDIECFFNAPYEVYVNDPTASYPLSFFVTHKAVSLYTSYLKMLRMLPPDHPTTIQWIRRSFAHIAKHCIKNNMPLTNYGSQSREAFVAPFLRDIKDGYTTIYALFAFPSALSTIQSLDPDVRQLMLGDMDVYQLYREFMDSKVAKLVANASYEALDKYLKTRRQSH